MMKCSQITWIALGLAVAASQSSMAAESAPPDVKPVRLTPFVLGQARSFAPRHVAPKTAREAIARKEVAAHGVTVLELPEDRMLNLMQVRRADGTLELRHQAAQPASEVDE